MFIFHFFTFKCHPNAFVKIRNVIKHSHITHRQTATCMHAHASASACMQAPTHMEEGCFTYDLENFRFNFVTIKVTSREDNYNSSVISGLLPA